MNNAAARLGGLVAVAALGFAFGSTSASVLASVAVVEAYRHVMWTAVARLKPVGCTTNPTIVLKAVDTPENRDAVDEALALGRGQSGDATRVAAATAGQLAGSVGVELLRLVPGCCVSTEVDGNLSFNVAASVASAHQIIDAYKKRGVGPERVLIKLASTWEEASVAERPIAAPA